jgi:hypothetical protein
MAYGLGDSPTPQQQLAFQTWVYQLPHIMPCSECQQHSGEYIQANPLSATSGRAASAWLAAFESAVSQRKGGKALTADDAFQRMMAAIRRARAAKARRGAMSTTTTMALIALAVIVVVALLVYARGRR